MKIFADDKLSKINELRKFSFNDFNYEIIEILDNPKISMEWNWDSGICPNCKTRINRKVTHTFYKIEILIPETKTIDNITRNDIVLFGDTLDKRKMLIDKTIYNQVFSKSKLFKKFEVK